MQPRNRGAQVFTYRELESATDGFSECNVVGRGAYGVVFRGRLGDGTTAAIKRLKMDGRREGEREFRIEVSRTSHSFTSITFYRSEAACYLRPKI